MSLWLLVFLSCIELLLFFAVVVFYVRLRRSEQALNELQSKQEALLERLASNAQLEQELVASFHHRQAELEGLNEDMAEQAEALTELIRQAERITRSPQSLRQIILNGHRRGQSARALAHSTGLSVEEVELILMEEQG